jgi:uncharacterized membrane protein YidH (DUF202 family)
MSAAESHESSDERLLAVVPPIVPTVPAPRGRILGAAALAIGIATVAVAFATPLRETLASGILAGLALVTSTLGLISRASARRSGERPPTTAIAAIWLGVGALAIVAISVLPALLMPTGTGVPG